MCGRYTQTAPAEQLRELFQFESDFELTPRYNIAPSQEVPVVRTNEDGSRTLGMIRWGLIPSWAKDGKIGYRTINARGETVAEKPSFRSAFKRRRCLIVADGFYEWKKKGKVKQPYYIHLKGKKPFAFAGLWECWEKGSEGPVESCTIVTTEANDLLKELHERMPVILSPADYALWLDPKTEGKEAIHPLIRPYFQGEMAFYPVSTRVNSPKNNDPACIEKRS